MRAARASTACRGGASVLGSWSMDSVVDRSGSSDRPARRLVELSHRVEHGMTTYPGLPGPEIGDHLARSDSRGRYAPGVEFQIGWIRLVANTGTYLDAPFHRGGRACGPAGAAGHRYRLVRGAARSGASAGRDTPECVTIFMNMGIRPVWPDIHHHRDRTRIHPRENPRPAASTCPTALPPPAADRYRRPAALTCPTARPPRGFSRPPGLDFPSFRRCLSHRPPGGVIPVGSPERRKVQTGTTAATQRRQRPGHAGRKTPSRPRRASRQRDEALFPEGGPLRRSRRRPAYHQGS